MNQLDSGVDFEVYEGGVFVAKPFTAINSLTCGDTPLQGWLSGYNSTYGPQVVSVCRRCNSSQTFPPKKTDFTDPCSFICLNCKKWWCLCDPGPRWTEPRTLRSRAGWLSDRQIADSCSTPELRKKFMQSKGVATFDYPNINNPGWERGDPGMRCVFDKMHIDEGGVGSVVFAVTCWHMAHSKVATENELEQRRIEYPWPKYSMGTTAALPPKLCSSMFEGTYIEVRQQF